MGFIIACVFLGIVIFFHELGHYLFAKLSGCAVSQFSLGFGPRMFGFKKKETDYRISWLPILGGYVKLTGMEGEAGSEDEEEIKTARKFKLKTFEEISTWSKLLIILGGILVQCLLCIVILSLLVVFIGRPVSRVVIVDPLPSSPALKAGLIAGDKLISIDDKDVFSSQQMIDMVNQSAGRPLKFVINREGKDLVFQIMPELNQKTSRLMIGVQVAESMLGDYTKKDMRFTDYLTGGLVLTYKMTVLMLQQLWLLVRGRVSLEAIAGPVGIVSLTSQVARTGFLNLITFFALINMNLALINSLPLPAVDGGHVAIILSEKICRRKIPAKAKNVINYVGYSFIILFLFLVTISDVRRLIFTRFQKPGPQVEQIDNNR